MIVNEKNPQTPNAVFRDFFLSGFPKIAQWYTQQQQPASSDAYARTFNKKEPQSAGVYTQTTSLSESGRGEGCEGG